MHNREVSGEINVGKKKRKIFFYKRSYVYSKRIRDASVAFCDFRNARHFVRLCNHIKYNHLYNGNKLNFLGGVL
jgi:hypothetical protein